jgi:hypothetical protein
MYLSIRTYRMAEGSIDEALHRVDRDLADVFAREEGFVAYQVTKTGDRTVAAVTVFREREQADASNDLAAQWVSEELADFQIERLGVIGGEIMVSRANAEMLEPAHH